MEYLIIMLSRLYKLEYVIINKYYKSLVKLGLVGQLSQHVMLMLGCLPSMIALKEDILIVPTNNYLSDKFGFA